MNLPALAVCILFVFCPPHVKHVTAKPAAQAKTGEPGAALRDARGRSCEQIIKGFDLSGNSDSLVSQFPVSQQRRVLICLDDAKRQGKT